MEAQFSGKMVNWSGLALVTVSKSFTIEIQRYRGHKGSGPEETVSVTG